MFNQKISVITPTWDRAEYLPQVWGGLCAQTYQNFEWIVANDGSTDDTVSVVYQLAEKSSFPVTLINASCRIGKSRMDNELIKAANGEFILWCDSDDILLPNALEKLINTWLAIPEQERLTYCGVSALCATEEGVLGNKFYQPDDSIALPWNDLFNKLNADLVTFTRADLLKRNPFLEVDFLIDETSVLNVIGIQNTMFIPQVLKRVRYGAKNALSYSGIMAYNRGHAYAIALGVSKTQGGFFSKFSHKVGINYLRYCIHGEVRFRQALQLVGAGTTDVIAFLFLFPISLALAMKDRYQGKVRKTHREFLAAHNKVKIEVLKLNCDRLVSSGAIP